jgi:hypothetical protein
MNKLFATMNPEIAADLKKVLPEDLSQLLDE